MGRPFPPGVSGNPGGRPKGLAAYVRERTRDGREIVEFMVRVLRDEDAKTSDRIEAAAWLAERGFGKVIVAEEEEAPVAVIINGDPELGPGVYRNAIKHA